MFLLAMINCETFTFKQVNSIFFLQVGKNQEFFECPYSGICCLTILCKNRHMSKIKLLSLRTILNCDEIKKFCWQQYFTVKFHLCCCFRDVINSYLEKEKKVITPVDQNDLTIIKLGKLKLGKTYQNVVSSTKIWRRIKTVCASV